MNTHTDYRLEFNVLDNWGCTPDKENWAIFEKDGSAPTENGLNMEDVGKSEWAKIVSEVKNFFNTDMNWDAFRGGDYTTIRVY